MVEVCPRRFCDHGDLEAANNTHGASLRKQEFSSISSGVCNRQDFCGKQRNDDSNQEEPNDTLVLRGNTKVMYQNEAADAERPFLETHL